MVLGSPKKCVSDNDSDGGWCADENRMELNSKVVVRDRQAGTSHKVQLTITRGHKKLIANDQEKPIAISSIRQLRTIKVDTEGVRKDVIVLSFPLTVVYVAWGRVKQLDVEFTSLPDYEAFLGVLASSIPAIPIVHLPASLLTIAPLPVAAPLSPRLALARVADPLSPRAFGHRPGDDTTYTMPPASPRAIRRAAATTKRRRAAPACRLPCLVPATFFDEPPAVVGAGHPHLQLPDFKILYDAGKQYDRSRRSCRTPAAAPPAGIAVAAQG